MENLQRAYQWNRTITPPYRIKRLESLDASTARILLDLWEGSVRATHVFLSDEDIGYLRFFVKDALYDVSLFVAETERGEIAGFAGVSEDKLEMLFVHVKRLRKGVGSLLLQHVLRKGVVRVDVNEHNPQAIEFYRKMGFQIVGRSELDGQGNPFPLLHLQVK